MELITQAVPPWKHVEWSESSRISSLELTYNNEWKTETETPIMKIKQEIEDLDKEHKWELAKKMVNPYELVYTHNDDRLPPSLSIVSPLSRSFFKMVEILDVLQFTKTVSTKFTSAHIAEGPGGFIQALYNVAETNKKVVTASIAMTLKPNNPHVPGWKKATQFLQRNKQINVHYGADGTGDVYKPENQESYIQQCKGLGGVKIFTADVGFDFSVDYSLQEQQVFHLLLSSTTTGLRVLKQGGCFVLKIFECISPHTKIFIQLLSSCFLKWTLYKPAMTRPCNSERYFLGKDFRVSSKPVIDMLIFMEQQVVQGNYPVTKTILPPCSFLELHITESTEKQIRSIIEAFKLANAPDEWWEKWYSIVLKKSYQWCENFKVFCTPVHSQISITLSKFPNHAAHISHKGAYQL
jgi:23S rRNA U2552 (ribose-2'-O)-methylase RlmE/FtsJ